MCPSVSLSPAAIYNIKNEKRVIFSDSLSAIKKIKKKEIDLPMRVKLLCRLGLPSNNSVNY